MKIILRFTMGLLWIGIGIQRLTQQSYPLALLFLAGGVLFVYAGWRRWKVGKQ
ncbi:hypothetical protein [Paenibacillus sp. MDMC362]|uniref:hypothetical protein n=1 Tax=Paenibacillus sp. MDMC362 TaxID=2977365 RepID=UPI0015EC6331|nr:hypothetical protein [Paenibacillus sp. MDMC362]